MIRFFKSPQPTILLIIPIIILAFRLTAVEDFVPLEADNMPLWRLIAGFFEVFPNWFNLLAVSGLITWQAIHFNRLMNFHEVLYKNSYVPALLYALFISSTPEFVTFHPVHFANLIMLIALNRLFTLFRSEASAGAIFDAAFLAGISALVYFPMIVMLVVLIISVTLMRSSNIREFLILLIGFSLPFFFTAALFFWNRELGENMLMYADKFRAAHWKVIFRSDVQLIILGAFTALILLVALVKLRTNYLKNVVRSRLYQKILLTYLLVAGGAVFLTEGDAVTHFAILSMPVTSFLTYLFVSGKKRLWMYDVLLGMYLAFIIMNHL